MPPPTAFKLKMVARRVQFRLPRRPMTASERLRKHSAARQVMRKHERHTKILSKSWMNMSNRELGEIASSGLIGRKNMAREVLMIPANERKRLLILGKAPHIEAASNESLRLVKKHLNTIKKINPGYQLTANDINRNLAIPQTHRRRIWFLLTRGGTINSLTNAEVAFLRKYKNYPGVSKNIVEAEFIRRKVKSFLNTGFQHWSAQQVQRNIQELESRTRRAPAQLAMALEGQAATQSGNRGRIRNTGGIFQVRPYQVTKIIVDLPANLTELRRHLSMMNINNARVKNWITSFKAYRNERHPNNNNAPTAPPEKKSFSSHQEKKNYDEARKVYSHNMKNWLFTMASLKASRGN